MRRRGFTVLVGAVVVLLLSLGVMVAPVPYVVLEPGPTWDTLGEVEGAPVIDVTGTEVSESAGELHLTTVSVRPRVTLLTAVTAWFDSSEAVVPEELVYPPEQSREEVEERNTEQFIRSQSSAEAAALSYLGYPGRVTVTEVVDGGPADGRLSPDDVITAVDGTEVTEVRQLQAAIRELPPGTGVTVGYERDGRPGEVTLTTEAAPGGGSRIGVRITHEFEVPFELDIALDDIIGGPSAGLMFALGIVDRLDPVDLTGGRVIAGTGTIDDQGTVGAIGGIPQKLVAARELGASVFLVPAGNCAEAVANAPPGVTLLRVGTLSQAVTGLTALRDGGEPPTC